jgi:hypothetical protein
VRRTSAERGDERVGCPAWCRRHHGRADHPEDRLHQSDPLLVPVVLGDLHLSHGAGARADSLVLRLVQPVDASTAWLEAVPEEGRSAYLLVTAESARRLAEAMTSLLARL